MRAPLVLLLALAACLGAAAAGGSFKTEFYAAEDTQCEEEPETVIDNRTGRCIANLSGPGTFRFTIVNNTLVQTDYSDSDCTDVVNTIELPCDVCLEELSLQYTECKSPAATAAPSLALTGLGLAATSVALLMAL